MGCVKSLFQYTVYILSSVAFATPLALCAQPIDVAGFASIAYGKTLSNDKQHADKKGGMYGMTNDGAMRDLSLVGLRANTQINDTGLSFTAQVVVYGADDFKPSFDWVYATYQFDPSWSLSVGRTRTPLFMYSAYQDVSYAYTWIKPPFSVYGIPQFKSVDGLKLRHQGLVGEWASDVQLWLGSIREDLIENSLDSELVLDHTLGLAWSVEREWLTLRAAYMHAETSLDLSNNAELNDFDQLLERIEADTSYSAATRASIRRLHERIEWEDDKAHFLGFGAMMDFGRYFLGTEATFIGVGESIAAPDTMQSYYIVMGMRVSRQWTFALTLIHDRDQAQHDLVKQYSQSIAPLIDPLDPFLSLLPSAQDFETLALDLQQFEVYGYSLTARWDFHKSAAAKVEFLQEQREYGDNSYRTKPMALRFGVDLVF